MCRLMLGIVSYNLSIVTVINSQEGLPVMALHANAIILVGDCSVILIASVIYNKQCC